MSAERVVSEFRSRRVAAEIVAFGEAAGITIQLTERALSNEVVTVGMRRQLLERCGERLRRTVHGGRATRAYESDEHAD